MLFPAPARAHGLIGRGDLPLPDWLLAWGAALLLIGCDGGGEGDHAVNRWVAENHADTDCDWVAEGVVQALREVQVDVPVIVRLAGTNVEEGRRILAESGLKLISAGDLADAAEKVAALVA